MEKKKPFKTPADYYIELLQGDPANINRFRELLDARPDWAGYDCDLHVYPYVHARPAALSFGCHNRCAFCPTAQLHQGNIVHGDPAAILPPYEGENVHFMDENFFRNDMSVVLPLTKRLRILWSCMADYKDTLEALSTWGEEALWDAGLRLVEVGLENVALYRKVKEPIVTKRVVIYYLNMTFLPGETKETIRANALWMREPGRTLLHPIHFNNGVWWAPGQFYFPYQPEKSPGVMLEGGTPRVQPTYVPDSFLREAVTITNLERVNFHTQMTYDFKLYPHKPVWHVEEFIAGDPWKAAWLAVGIRTGGIR